MFIGGADESTVTFVRYLPVLNSTENSSICKFHNQVFFALKVIIAQFHFFLIL